MIMHLDMEAQKDEKEQAAEPRSEPAKPEPPGEPATLETGGPEPAKLEPEANTSPSKSNKGRQVKKCCPL